MVSLCRPVFTRLSRFLFFLIHLKNLCGGLVRTWLGLVEIPSSYGRLFISTKFRKFWIQGFLKEYLEVLLLESFHPHFVTSKGTKLVTSGLKSNQIVKLKEGPIN